MPLLKANNERLYQPTQEPAVYRSPSFPGTVEDTASGLVEPATALTPGKMIGAQPAGTEQFPHQVLHIGPQRLDQIQRQRGSIMRRLVQITDGRIQSGGNGCLHRLGRGQGVPQGQQGIDRIRRWSAATTGKSQGGWQHGLQSPEHGRRRCAFESAKTVRILRFGAKPFLQPIEIRPFTGERGTPIRTRTKPTAQQTRLMSQFTKGCIIVRTILN